MKTQFQYFNIVSLERKPKTNVYNIEPLHGGSLGIIKWYAPWRQYCFFPQPHTVFSKGCLADLEVALTQLNWEHKNLERGV